MRDVAVARFARTLATMLSSGVPMLRALDIVKRILGNTVLEKVVEDARDAIPEGESIAAPLKRSGEFPPIMIHMIAVGERSGQLEQMLENVAGAYELEVDTKIARLTTLLEPLMIVMMGWSSRSSCSRSCNADPRHAEFRGVTGRAQCEQEGSPRHDKRTKVRLDVAHATSSEVSRCSRS